MTSSAKSRIHDLLKGIENGDPASVEVVNEAKYIQHNPHNREGSEGLAELFARLAQTSPRVEIVRIFEDGDIVFAHTEYDFSAVVIGFEVFRLLVASFIGGLRIRIHTSFYDRVHVPRLRIALGSPAYSAGFDPWDRSGAVV